MAKVKGICAYGGKWRSCCVVYRVIFRQHISVYVRNIENTLIKITEQHFQDVSKKVQHDKSPDTFMAHFAQHLTKKPTPQQCCKIMISEIPSTAKPIRLMIT